MKILKLITVLMVANGFANAADETSRNLWDSAQLAKQSGDFPSYLLKMHKAAQSACAEVAAGKLRFADAAPLFAEALVKPQPEIAATDSTDTLLVQRAALLNKLSGLTSAIVGQSGQEFNVGRETLAKAVINFYIWVDDASQLKTLQRAEDEVKAARKAFDELPASVRADPDAWDRAIGQGFDHIKNPVLKQSMMRERSAQTAAAYAKSALKTATDLLPKVTQNAATMIRALYAQDQDARTDLDRILTECAVNDGPLVEAVRLKQ